MNVGIVFIGMGNLHGAGGAERFFADFFEAYNSQSNPKRKLYFISDNLNPLYDINRLNKFKDRQLVFKSYRYNFFHGYTKNRPRIDHVMNYIRAFFSMISMRKLLLKYNIRALQLPLYEDKDYYLLKLSDKFSLWKRPKLVLNVTNAVVQDHYFDTNPKYAYHSKLNYGRLFENIRLDGVYTWYKAFKKFAEEKNVIKSNPPIHAVSSRFTSTDFYEDFSKKEKHIIFSGRLSEYKDPLLFVKAAELFSQKNPKSGWYFLMFGKGALETEVKDYIKEHNLSDIVKLGFTPDVPAELRKSRIYISTQNAENFPSLAMAEAMATGNLIIARNVGQTDYYVKDGMNGYLMKTDSPAELAEIISKAISEPKKMESMARESIRLLKEVHNKENFISEIDQFWDSLE